jgi:hypothetical protein
MQFSILFGIFSAKSTCGRSFLRPRKLLDANGSFRILPRARLLLSEINFASVIDDLCLQLSYIETPYNFRARHHGTL